jgi:protocatechuate 3,4-dioxygenase beta subunit
MDNAVVREGRPRQRAGPVYRKIPNPKARDSVSVDFVPVKNSRVGELAAKFDMVMGFTPEG